MTKVTTATTTKQVRDEDRAVYFGQQQHLPSIYHECQSIYQCASSSGYKSSDKDSKTDDTTTVNLIVTNNITATTKITTIETIDISATDTETIGGNNSSNNIENDLANEPNKRIDQSRDTVNDNQTQNPTQDSSQNITNMNKNSSIESNDSSDSNRNVKNLNKEKILEASFRHEKNVLVDLDSGRDESVTNGSTVKSTDNLIKNATTSATLATTGNSVISFSQDNNHQSLHYVDEESWLLIQKLTINNPFYRFHKQSQSLRDKNPTNHNQQTSFNYVKHLRKFKSDSDLRKFLKTNLNVKLTSNNKNNVIVLAQSKLTQNKNLMNIWLRGEEEGGGKIIGEPAVTVAAATMCVTTKPNDFHMNSTVITNPFSIFHEDETQMTLRVDTRLRCASNASRRVIRKPQQRAFMSQHQLPNYHHVYGVPIKHYERQDFPLHHDRLRRKSKLLSGSTGNVFKQLSLRKLNKSTHVSIPQHQDLTANANGPQLKKLKLNYPSSTQIGLTRVNTLVPPTAASKHNYFSRLHAKTKQGFQKFKDKCRLIKHETSHLGHRSSHTGTFQTLAKVESFRFISDKAHIKHYENRCNLAYQEALQHQQHSQPAITLYKSYKSELDLSKNINYLEAYLNENFENPNSQYVSRANQKSRPPLTNNHKRSFSTITTSTTAQKHNYENLNTLPMQNSDSLTSSDYASVFSAGAKELILKKTDTSDDEGIEKEKSILKYEHPKMSLFLKDSKRGVETEVEKDLRAEFSRSPCNSEGLKLDLFYRPELLNHHLNLEQEIDDNDDTAANSIRILINATDDFEVDGGTHRGWYNAQHLETDSTMSAIDFYQSLNQHLQQEEEIEQKLVPSPYEVYLEHYQKSITPPTTTTTSSYTTDDYQSSLYYDKDLIAYETDSCSLGPSSNNDRRREESTRKKSPSSMSRHRLRNKSLMNNKNYGLTENELMQHKALNLVDYRNVALTQSSFKNYKTSMSNSSSSTSSLAPQQLYAGGVNITNRNQLNQFKALSGKSSLAQQQQQQEDIRRPSNASNTSSSDNFDNFISLRTSSNDGCSNTQKMPSKRTMYQHYSQQPQQRSPNTPSSGPSYSSLNYYGCVTTQLPATHDTSICSVSHKAQSSSSSSNHSSKLSNSPITSTSNSTTATSVAAAAALFTTNPNAIALPSGAPTLAATSAHNQVNISAAGVLKGATTNSQMNLTKLFRNSTTTNNSSPNTTASVMVNYHQLHHHHSHHQNEPRDKFIIEYEC
ncbi:hypothetical protein GQX74_011311 [Glossina fuscipes]|nr:hypothetical protein GQX74_011311 [Glossina fuscipes]